MPKHKTPPSCCGKCRKWLHGMLDFGVCFYDDALRTYRYSPCAAITANGKEMFKPIGGGR